MFEPRKSVSEIEKPHHGGMKEKEIEEHGYTPDEVIDFSASLNPYGPPKVLLKEIWSTEKEDLKYYPDSDSTNLRKKIAVEHDLEPENVIVTAGMSELIDMVGRTYVKKATPVIIPKHTYGEYEPSSRINGAEIKKAMMPEQEVRPEEINREITQNSIVFLCNPNNPTGDLLSKNEISIIMDKVNETNSLLVIDEAYHDFIQNPPRHQDFIKEKNDIIVMRTYTKAYNIPGIRVGYGLSTQKHIQNLMKTKIPWNLGDIPQRVIESLHTTEAKEFMEKSRRKLIRNKKTMLKEIEGLGLKTTRSKANFITIDVGDAASKREKLLDEGLIVRDCSSFGLPRHIRVAVREKKENEKLIQALKES
ncbi:histidinol-phosphate transaminase [Methanonatronarchaeum sp. AMET6-2]|uniref:pyridoxal phosphate-dependent aminotransferase n=1 Tax=Methanonatronarchaeum sp. AMET6-2 TaxID=2933293 RepID=UPI00121DB5B3|nr:histidinol-phosphate transaminase [Methanonatronarchaeum sp. AMET6-2]RZN62904.1 MAG: histidinol-phosphate aminotransferase family protein [Methanonatronarchaeia archaeon]UOY09834.1 histidinol-phosphate aminotransferase family protein [Methanonatronarchaeum sp. AMET6-2]